jgi:signal transduction histidine kinase
VGFYLRSLDAERARSVAAARQAQRLDLARDLHDFVAHDVSEMLAQAQAGPFLTGRGPQQATDAFRRIEEAGLHALASLDRTVRMLHDDTDPVVQLTIDAQLTERDSAVPRDVATTVYRIVVEALTNVRRHAPTARLVQVDVCRTQATAGLVGPAVEVTVTDDARTARAPGAHAQGPLDRSNGLGLSGLAERIRALGGTLTAGPREETAADPQRRPGWCVTAVLPLAAARPAEAPA